MPYRDPETRKAYAQRKSREHYREHRQQYIDRAARRKRRLRTMGKEWDMTMAKACPKCDGPMTKEEVGGRRFWDCPKADCTGRILLDRQTRSAHLSAESIAALAQPNGRLPAHLTMDDPRGATAAKNAPAKRHRLREDVRRKIGEGVRKAAAARRQSEPPTPACPPDDRTIPSTVTVGPGEAVRPPAVNPLTALEHALRELEAEEESLHARLTQNQARQTALKQAAAIVREVAA